MKCSIFTIRSLALVSTFLFSMTCMGIAQAKECDMPDEIAAGDSAAVRDECPNQDEPAQKNSERQKSPMDSSGVNADNLGKGYEEYNNDKEYSGTGPKRDGRY
ncbi:MAG: hypothetical protein ABJA60_02485 [Nitrosospira sp.]